MSYRYRLAPEPDQTEVMSGHCGQARLIWNIALEQMGAACSMGLRCDWKLWETQLAELRNTEGLEWLKDGSSAVQQQALRQLCRAFMNFWENPAHFGRPRFRSKARTTDGFVVRDVRVRNLNRKWSSVFVPKAGWVKFRRDRALGGHGMAHVTRGRSGRWHVSFSAAQTPVKDTDGFEGRAVGVDRGITGTVATSDGELLNIPQASREEVRQLKKLQRRLARQQRGSRRYQRNKASIAKIRARWADRRKDRVEKTSTKLVSENAVIVCENLKVANMMRSASGTVEIPGTNVAAKRGLNAAIAASCWGMLEAAHPPEGRGQRPDLHPRASRPHRPEVQPLRPHQQRQPRRQALRVHVVRPRRRRRHQRGDNILAAGLAVIRREGTNSGDIPKSGRRSVNHTYRHPSPHRETLPFRAGEVICRYLGPRCRIRSLRLSLMSRSILAANPTMLASSRASRTRRRRRPAPGDAGPSSTSSASTRRPASR